MRAVTISGIATPVHGAESVKVMYQRYMDAKGRTMEGIEYRRVSLKRRKSAAAIHIAKGKVAKKPTETVKWILPAFSEKIPIKMRNTLDMANTIIPNRKAILLVLVRNQIVKRKQDNPEMIRPLLNKMATANPLL